MSALKIILISLFLIIAFHLFLYSYMQRRIAAAKLAARAAPKHQVAGGCHCGAVRFTLQSQPAVELLDCNCSICSATGFQHLIIGHDDFTLITNQDALVRYRFAAGMAEHLFCSTCGIKSFYQPRSHPDCWSVNFRCLDDGHGLFPVTRMFDGKNWDEAKADLTGDPI